MPEFDCAVVGAGVFGAWTAYCLQRSGQRVALIDSRGPGNSQSSSGGESRVIRSSYGAEQIYALWAHRSLAAWTRLFEDAGRPELFYPAGVLWTAPEGDVRVAQNRAALESSGVRFELLTHAQIERRFPQFHFSWPVTGVFEPDSGAILARRAVRTVVDEAVRLGVTYRNAAAESPAGSGKIGRIGIGAGEFIAAGQFVYACGPWLPKVFPALLHGRIRPTRQELFFYAPPPGDRRFNPEEMPVWLDYTDPRGGYSIPNLESRGLKLAFDRHGPEADPDTMERVVGPESIGFARAFLRERFPDLGEAPLVESRVCQYENSSNGDFLIDRHPDFENVWIAGGGSGHGFKHGPAVGEYVAGLLNGTIPAEPRFSLESKLAAHARSVY